jgi:hypothetical protein
MRLAVWGGVGDGFIGRLRAVVSARTTELRSLLLLFHLIYYHLCLDGILGDRGTCICAPIQARFEYYFLRARLVYLDY